MRAWPGISTYEYWQGRRTEAMRSLLDSPIFTNLSTNILNQKDTTMRLTKAQKAANETAALKAHVAQCQALNGRLQSTNVELGVTISKLERDQSAAAMILAEKSKDIAAFKQEVLALTTENATLRGYVARVLEDDTVREVGGAKSAEHVLCDEDRSHMQQALHQDNFSRRQPPRSVRTGVVSTPASIWEGSQWDGQINHTNRNAGSGSVGNSNRHWLTR